MFQYLDYIFFLILVFKFTYSCELKMSNETVKLLIFKIRKLKLVSKFILYSLKQQQHEFPALKNDLIIRAAKGESVDRVPIWIMRQAGRYLPEFREMRTKHSFFDLVQNPQLACEVTMMVKKIFSLIF